MNYRSAAALSLCLFVSVSLHAQWTEPDASSVATTDKVSIGSSSAPVKQLEVIGEGSFTSFLTAAEIIVTPSSGTPRGRVQMNGSEWFGMMLNARINTQWDLDDTSLPGWIAKLDGRSGYDQFAIMRVPPGSNPHTDEKTLFQVHANGKIGMGVPTGTPAAERLQVYENADQQSVIVMDNPFAGTNSLAALRAKSNLATTNLIAHSTSRTLTRFGTTLGGWAELLNTYGNGQIIGTLSATPLILGTNSANRIHIAGDGKVGINNPSPLVTLDVIGHGKISGDLVVGGNIGARYQDVAEWVPATEDLAPGTVVILNPASINEVMPSTKAYDTRVAGVVSAQPGIILGEAGARKEQIATTGRVKVRVDATSGAIAVGDLLVTSDVAGTAMKSQPLDLGGVAIHRPGTIVGKALEPLAEGTAEILVLLSLQ